MYHVIRETVDGECQAQSFHYAECAFLAFQAMVDLSDTGKAELNNETAVIRHYERKAQSSLTPILAAHLSG